MNLIELAVRNKYRFQTNQGLVTVEDLFDLPLQSAHGASLDAVAIALNKQIKELGEESFVGETPVGSQKLNNQLEIVTYVIAIKKEANAKVTEAAAKASQKAKIEELIARKQDSALEEKSLEELQKELASLS